MEHKRWRSIRKSVVINLEIIAALLLGLMFWDIIIGDGNIPTNRALNPRDRTIALQYLYAKPQSLEECWLSLQPTLKLLDKVNPDAVNWIEDRYLAGDLVFYTEFDGCLAKYDYFTKTLLINASFFNRNEGDKAAILCHEYRHSRQNIGKVTRLILSHVIGVGDTDIVENDAYLYEYEALVAIFGPLH